MSGKTKIISDKIVLKAEHFVVKETLLDIEGRGKIKRLDVERRPTVAIFPITENHQIYLISEYRYLLKKAVLGSIAGFVEPNEDSLEAAKRELKEETGLHASSWKELAIAEMARSVIKAKAYLYLAKDAKEGKTSLDFDEDIKVVKMPLEEAVEKVMSGEIQTAVSMIGILILDRMKREDRL